MMPSGATAVYIEGLKQSTALQQQQQSYPVTPEDGQLGRNM
jgi:hypothetical protein